MKYIICLLTMILAGCEPRENGLRFPYRCYGPVAEIHEIDKTHVDVYLWGELIDHVEFRGRKYLVEGTNCFELLPNAREEKP